MYFILITLFSVYVTGANEMEFRLKKFDDQANDGIAQLFFNGTLGAVDIADPDINVNFTAKALCNSIGLGYKGFTSRNYNGSPMLTWINDFTCNASYAADCLDEKSLILRNTTISAIVHCYAYEITDIRLTGDILPSRGFVEFKISERWVAVNTSKRFDYSRNDGIGETFCQALGYVGESIILPKTRGSGNTIMAISFDRTGYCDVIGSIFDITHKCETRLNLSTSSFMQIYCMPIRLVDGQSVLKGRVEATLFGRIHTICGRGFDNNAANVACKSLGFRGLSKLNLKTEYGVGNLTLYSRKISCDGTELSLEQCNHSNVDIEACGVEDVVSVTCKGNQVQLETFSEARPYEGILTAYYDSHLYYIQTYSVLTGTLVGTARTICSWLGFGSVGFFQMSTYRRNTTYYKFSFSCKGNENYIDECSGSFRSCPYDDCTTAIQGGGLAVLFCSDYKIQRVNLVSGVIKLTINNETWSVCGEASSETFKTSADTVCKILGHTGSASVNTSPIQSTDQPAIGWLTCESGSLTAAECTILHVNEMRPYQEEGSSCRSKFGVTCNNDCRQGYFGENCSECLCKSVNTQACNVITGECICKQGWSGITCSDDTDECKTASDTCNYPSTCVNTRGSYFCQCPLGMYMNGSDCEVCQNNTYGINCLERCLCNTNNTYANDSECDPATGKCFCKPGWTGSACDSDVNECITPSSYFCQQDNTECVNIEGGYNCLCIDNFKWENGTCLQIQSSEVRETGSNLLITAILSSIGGVIFFVIIITAAVCYIRKHKVTSVGKQNASHSSQYNLDTIDYSTGRVPADIELDENACTDNPYQEIKEGNVGSNDYIEFSESLNDHYDSLDNAKMQMLRSGNLASDGYLKPIQKDGDISGERLRPQEINGREPDNDIPIMSSQLENGREYDNDLPKMSSQLEDTASGGYLHPV